MFCPRCQADLTKKNSLVVKYRAIAYVLAQETSDGVMEITTDKTIWDANFESWEGIECGVCGNAVPASRDKEGKMQIYFNDFYE